LIYVLHVAFWLFTFTWLRLRLPFRFYHVTHRIRCWFFYGCVWLRLFRYVTAVLRWFGYVTPAVRGSAAPRWYRVTTFTRTVTLTTFAVTPVITLRCYGSLRCARYIYRGYPLRLGYRLRCALPLVCCYVAHLHYVAHVTHCCLPLPFPIDTVYVRGLLHGWLRWFALLRYGCCRLPRVTHGTHTFTLHRFYGCLHLRLHTVTRLPRFAVLFTRLGLRYTLRFGSLRLLRYGYALLRSCFYVTHGLVTRCTSVLVTFTLTPARALIDWFYLRARLVLRLRLRSGCYIYVYA